MNSKLVLAAIIALHLFLFSKLTFLPTPELFVYPYLVNHGLKPYSQILDQHFPGLMFLPINFNNLGMTDEIVARWWLMVVILITQLMLFFITKAITKSEKKALLVNLLYFIWQPYFEGWTFWLDNLLPLFLLPAFYFSYKFIYENSSKKWLFLTGLFLGIGVIFKQVLLPVSGLFIVYLLFKTRKISNLAVFLLGFAPPILLIFLYLWKIQVLSDFWYWTVIFNLEVFSKYGRKPPTFSQLIRVLYVLVPSGLCFFSKQKKIVIHIFVFLISSLASINARFDFVHLQPALPFALIGTVVGGSSLWNNFKFRYVTVVFLIITLWWVGLFYKVSLNGYIWFFNSDTKLVASKIKQNTKPGEKIFIFGAIPSLYFMSDTMPTGDVFVYQFPWFLRVAEERVFEGLKKDQPNLVISDRSVEIDGQKLTDYASDIDQYIQSNYQIIDQVDSTQIMRKKSP